MERRWVVVDMARRRDRRRMNSGEAMIVILGNARSMVRNLKRWNILQKGLL